MASPSSFNCVCCAHHHAKQAFVSHASKDREIADELKRACCEVGVAPYLYEFDPESRSQAPPADTISEQVVKSDIHFVLLGESVSEAYWTQAWLGFEVGISKGIAIQTNMPKNVIVIQDIREGVRASIPMLDAHFLFDFASKKGWDQFTGLVLVLANLVGSGEFFKVANRFRSATIKANVVCGNCKSQYEAWIAKDDAQKLRRGFKRLKMGPELHAECTIECPSCDKMVTRVFVQMLPS